MMGEVGDSIPEKSAVEQIPTTAIARSEAPVNPLVQQNGDVLKITAQPPEEPMIVDSDDDSQNSCDNQSDIKATESTTANGDVETSQDGSNGRRHSKDDVDTKDSHAENCSDDDDDDDDEKTETEKSDGKKNGNSTENEESRDGGVSETQTSQDDGEEVDESQDDTSQSVTNDDDSQQSSHPPSKNGEDKSPPHVVEKLNGEAPKLIQDDDGVVDLDESDEEMPMTDEAPKTNVEEKNPLKLPDAEENKEAKAPQRTISDSDGAVVIGSDSECEPEKELPPPAIPVPPPAAKSPQSQVQPQSHLQSQSNLQPQSQSLPQSQSQPQLPPVEKPRPPPLPPKPDDDDDDCVLIEDDSPSEASEAGSTVSGRQRKSLVKVRDFAAFGDDQRLETDDSQPPSKRQRTSPNVVPSVVAGTQSPMAQITIKDARSLMPAGTVKSNVIASGGKEPTLVIIDTDTTKPSAPSLPPPGIFPVNIRPAMLSNQPQPQPQPQPQAQPAAPKAIPTMPVSTGVPALPTISNANLLPGLTDDMFVLEAPSFIVPYIYEKPPSDNLREIVNQIEMKFDLKKADNVYSEDDLDLGDDGKDANECAATTSKKKKKKRGSGDDSWSESDDSGDDDDDEDSESETRTKVLIKEASDDLKAIKAVIKPIQPTAPVVTSPSAPNANKQPNGENYFESPLGKFFMDIGAGQVQEFVQADLLRLQKRKMRRSLGKNITEIERAITALSGNLEASKKRNSAFKFNIKRCEFCNFKSESALAMAHHYETPHMNGVLYKCNFCTYEIRNSTEIVYHMEAMHNIKARLFKHLPYHQCPNCGFEDNGKAKLARHAPVCVKKFRPEVNLAPPHDWEAPAKIPRIKPRHGLVGTATAYQAMAAQAAAQKAALASIQQQQQQAQQARNIQAAMANNNVNKNLIRGRPQTVTKTTPNGGTVLRPGNPPVRAPMPTGMVPPNNYQIAAGQLIHVSGPGLAILPTSQNTLTLQTANAAAATKKTPSGQPSISITPLPRQSSNTPQAQPSASGNKIPPTGMKPGQNPSGNKAQFVICEICDGYIKDLEQLRNHMQWMHKVKIHPKMIYNRPPLNCQKCQFRFFTDQGLERHLLGSHGLVTSSMQEAANKGKDAGRCPVCGRMYQWKLLNHVSRDHHMTLKPAHLSYKCTVCTATFGMYKQFETHVYTAHSTVAKKAMDGKKNNSGSSSMMNNSGGGGIMNTRHSLSSANDSLLKPLKINDEITIIPQPASKSRSSMNNIESHVID